MTALCPLTQIIGGISLHGEGAPSEKALSSWARRGVRSGFEVDGIVCVVRGAGMRCTWDCQ